MNRPAAFLDRDGTLIEDLDYLGDPDGVKLLPGVARAVRKLTDAGIPIIVVTNQSGIGRGYFSDDDYRAVEARVGETIRSEGAEILATYYCPHAPDLDPPCDCRKPAAGMFEAAAREHGIDLSASLFVGDRPRDVVAGIAAGGTGILVHRNGENGGKPAVESVPAGTRVARTLDEAVDWWLASRDRNRSD